MLQSLVTLRRALGLFFVVQLIASVCVAAPTLDAFRPSNRNYRLSASLEQDLATYRLLNKKHCSFNKEDNTYSVFMDPNNKHLAWEIPVAISLLALAREMLGEAVAWNDDGLAVAALGFGAVSAAILYDTVYRIAKNVTQQPAMRFTPTHLEMHRRTFSHGIEVKKIAWKDIKSISTETRHVINLRTGERFETFYMMHLDTQNGDAFHDDYMRLVRWTNGRVPFLSSGPSLSRIITDYSFTDLCSLYWLRYR